MGFSIAYVFLILISIVIEIVSVIVSLISGTFWWPELVVFAIYLFSIIFMEKIAGLKSPFRKILLIVILPILSICFLVYMKGSWYTAYNKKASSVTVFIINESKLETVTNLCSYNEIQSKDIRDKAAKIIGLHEDKMNQKVNFNPKLGNVLSFRVRPGNYQLYVKTQNRDQKTKYQVDLNTESIDLEPNTTVFFCFGGMNFFQFNPTTEQEAEIKKLDHRGDKYTGEISMATSAPKSVKKEVKY